MRALDIEDNIEHLPYDKVIGATLSNRIGEGLGVRFATDADVDGLHIRNLLITYFFKFFESGRAQAPRARRSSLRDRDAALPRAQQTGDNLLLQRSRARRGVREAGRQTRDHALQRAGRNFPERVQAIHRQGNAPEVASARAKVEYAPKVDSQQILSFYMGKNTPERKDYIMENLVVTVEE
jgi:topoisomerase IV subunit B